MDTIPTIPAQRATNFDFSAEDPIGACMCPEFAHGRRQLHVTGQPGCVDEIVDEALAS